jgi:glycosyltransferase involved in cell wall biosynthesis
MHSPPINLSFISPLYYGGGAERAARELSEELINDGKTIEFYVARRQPNDPSFVNQVRLAGEKYLNRLCILLGIENVGYWGSRLAFGRINKKRVDLVHLHNLHGNWASLPSIHALSKRLPTVWTLHDEWAINAGIAYDLSRNLSDAEIDAVFGDRSHLYKSSHLRNRALKTRVLRSMPQASAVIAPSRYLYELAREFPPFKGVPIVKIPYGVRFLDNPSALTPRARAKSLLNVPASKKIIFLVAANFDSPYKGMTIAKEVLKRFEGDEYLILVAGRNTKKLLGLLPVEAMDLGFLSSDAELAQAYRAADLTLIPSIADNFPYTALESMACETPIACFKIGGLSELVGDNERGFGAHPFDVDGLVLGIKDLMNDPKFSEIGKSARRWVQLNCSMSDYKEQVKEVYMKAIEHFHSAPRKTQV